MTLRCTSKRQHDDTTLGRPIAHREKWLLFCEMKVVNRNFVQGKRLKYANLKLNHESEEKLARKNELRLGMRRGTKTLRIAVRKQSHVTLTQTFVSKFVSFGLRLAILLKIRKDLIIHSQQSLPLIVS